MMSIGDMARETGVKVPTIRYYEQIGLLPDPGRTQGNQRRYGAAERDRLAFIRHARDLGFSIESIRDLVALSGNPGAPCTDADRIAGAQLDDVRARIARLQALERELARIAACNGEHAGTCRVLQALSDHGLCNGDH
ncbi:MAG: helix-turn-helix domain-containing protein [Notoacmeibacter sp.]|nr:helix-turn-helix domain-containing protein [Notoacmeibacter sp.]MCC0032934.1 helix-turn-helix domain-containing protein [Brucellaceae bacterium]